MAKYYFTYGTEGQPYRGGWTTVEAPDRKSACAAFRFFHPDRNEGLLNCCSCYGEREFNSTCMATEGNFGKFEQERITLSCTHPKEATQ